MTKEETPWQPIDTAPRDGTWVLLAGGECRDEEGDNDRRVVSGQWTDDLNGRKRDWHWQFAWYDGGYFGQYDAPTHWMPLPVHPITPPCAAKE